MRFFERSGTKNPDRPGARIPPWLLAFLLTGCPLPVLDLPGTGGSSGTSSSSTIFTMTGCSMPRECDDGNPCTVDTCENGVCSYAAAAEGTACPDATQCNGEETCDGKGVCRPGVAKSFDDGDPCTLDICDQKSGSVTHPTSPACGSWAPVATDGAPLARTRHTAVWTGTEMIVWGGEVTKKDDPAGVTATGARYDPAAKTWKAMSTAGAPPPRHSHTAVWTGSKMIVWGGYGATMQETAGGAYDPATDTWSALSTTNVPQGRVQHTAVWTGTEMVVWGGVNGGALATGARYDLAADTWTTLPTGPSPRDNHGAVFTGTQMIVWGGSDLINWHKDGFYFDPALAPVNAWTGPTQTTDAPTEREGFSTLWSGTQMVVWGGFDGGKFLDSGATLDPAGANGGTWTALTQTGAPSGRQQFASVWAGSQMMVWGGCGGDSCFTTLDDGGLWVPGANGGTWKAVPSGKVASPRVFATAVWTGSEVIIWGGKAGSTGKILGDGAQSAP